ncbi:hypothetical protein DYB32_006974, partial [Aphanomyces invadans]
MQNAETAGPSTSGDGHLMRDAKLLAANYEKCIALRILLQDISATMSMRIQAIESSLGVSEVALEAQDAAVLNMVQAHEQVEEELNAIFAVLQHHRVDPALVSDLNSISKLTRSVKISGEAKKTLFDFIDADTVMDLQRQAKTHIHRLVDSRRRNADSVNALRSTVLFYQGLDFNKMVPRSAPEHSVWEALGDVCQSVQEEVYELKLRHLMYFVDMEQCDRRVLHTFSTMHDVSQMYDVALVECHALLDELSNLLRFYQRFVGAYVALPLEMQRRRDQDRKCPTIAKKLQLVDNSKTLKVSKIVNATGYSRSALYKWRKDEDVLKAFAGSKTRMKNARGQGAKPILPDPDGLKTYLKDLRREDRPVTSRHAIEYIKTFNY